jgi:Uma2 family endonuclease
MTLADEKTITPDELLMMSDAVDYELVDGKLVKRNMGTESSMIAARILYLIAVFLDGKQLGFVAGADCSYQCFPDSPAKVRKPDVSFIRRGRLPNDKPPKGHCKIAPDLAIEVISPGDTASELDDKVKEYLDAGVRLVWVVNPTSKSVRIHRPLSAKPGPSGPLFGADVITGEDVLSGFESRVEEFFKLV